MAKSAFRAPVSSVFFVLGVHTMAASFPKYVHQTRSIRNEEASSTSGAAVVPFPADRNESHKSRCQIVVDRPRSPRCPFVVSSRSRHVSALSLALSFSISRRVSFCPRHSLAGRSRLIYLSFSPSRPGALSRLARSLCVALIRFIVRAYIPFGTSHLFRSSSEREGPRFAIGKRRPTLF